MSRLEMDFSHMWPHFFTKLMSDINKLRVDIIPYIEVEYTLNQEMNSKCIKY